MRSFISSACLLFCTCSLHGQITVAVKPLASGQVEFHVRNDGPSALQAYAITTLLKKESGETLIKFYTDSILDANAAPLAPHDERVATRGIFRMNAQQALQVASQPPTVAGIFSDGVTTGDSTLLASMMLRRSSALLAIETSLDVLSDAGNHNIDRERLIGQFRKMAEFANRWYLTPEQRASHDIYQSILGKLINLPELPYGSAFPPTPFVEQETAALRQRRDALIEARPNLADAGTLPLVAARPH